MRRTGCRGGDHAGHHEVRAMIRLTKHENEKFQNQTVYLSGQAFINCTFIACTMVLRETVYHLQDCTFERCNWHVDLILLWGSGESVQEIKSLVRMIEAAQAEQQAKEGAGAGEEGQPEGDELATKAPPTVDPSTFAS
jgi:hypothetical protein